MDCNVSDLRNRSIAPHDGWHAERRVNYGMYSATEVSYSPGYIFKVVRLWQEVHSPLLYWRIDTYWFFHALWGGVKVWWTPCGAKGCLFELQWGWIAKHSNDQEQSADFLNVDHPVWGVWGRGVISSPLNEDDDRPLHRAATALAFEVMQCQENGKRETNRKRRIDGREKLLSSAPRFTVRIG